jgi:hypothetical protein
MRREKVIDRIENTKSWDFLVIGGGATGLGVAVARPRVVMAPCWSNRMILPKERRAAVQS